MLANFWPRYQVYTLYFPLKLRRLIARDPVTSCAEPIFFNQITCEGVVPALILGITWDILGCPSSEPARQLRPMSQMSSVSLGLPGTSWNVPPKSQLHSLVP